MRQPATSGVGRPPGHTRCDVGFGVAGRSEGASGPPTLAESVRGPPGGTHRHAGLGHRGRYDPAIHGRALVVADYGQSGTLTGCSLRANLVVTHMGRHSAWGTAPAAGPRGRQRPYITLSRPRDRPGAKAPVAAAQHRKTSSYGLKAVVGLDIGNATIKVPRCALSGGRPQVTALGIAPLHRKASTRVPSSTPRSLRGDQGAPGQLGRPGKARRQFCRGAAIAVVRIIEVPK
jgi:hypothetical protein